MWPRAVQDVAVPDRVGLHRPFLWMMGVCSGTMRLWIAPPHDVHIVQPCRMRDDAIYVCSP